MDKNTQTLGVEDFRVRLKKNGLKVTPQRIAVHKAMLKLGHACADDVTGEILKDGETKVTVASVYNILTQFSLLGIYQHRMSSNNKMYFDVNTFKHIHVYDTENHMYIDVKDEDLYKEIESKRIANAAEVLEFLTSALRGEVTDENVVVEGTGDGFQEFPYLYLPG